MAIPASVDFAKVAHHALADAALGSTRWLEGRPRDEVAFMNHVTGRIARRRRGRDVGFRVPVEMQSRVFELHRKDPRQTDRYGADLAVTVMIPDDVLITTALLQIKRSQDYSVKVELRQLEDADADAPTRNRSFVLAVDARPRRSLRG